MGSFTVVVREMQITTGLGLCALLLTLGCGSTERANNDNPGSGGAAGTLPIDALAKPWASAACAYFARCFPYDPFADIPGGCVALEQPRFENGSIPNLKAKIASGKVSYHADKIAACLESYASAPCWSDDAVVMGCTAAIDGTVPLGGACTEELECAGDAHCDEGAGCPGVCKAPIALGETCSLSRDCRAGLGCATGTGACTVLAQKGEACRGATAGECSAGLSCVGASGDLAGTCQALRTVQVGEPCGISSATVCAEGLSCVLVDKAANEDSQICVAPAPSLGPCAVGTQDSCPLGEYCPLTALDLLSGVYTATCRPLAKEGEACVASGSACGATGVCRADGHCIELRKVGEACQDDDDCYTGACVSSVCQVDMGCR